MIHQYERQINELNRRIDETFARRSEGAEQWKAWEEACRAWHTYESPFDEFWTSKTQLKIEQGEEYWRHYAITFLEEDPWYFRSGYLKERLIRSLKRACLTPDERRRVQRLLLRVVDSRHRREFRDFCRLAVSVADANFVHQIQQRLTSSDEGTRLRATWMLDYITRHASESA